MEGLGSEGERAGSLGTVETGLVSGTERGTGKSKWGVLKRILLNGEVGSGRLLTHSRGRHGSGQSWVVRRRLYGPRHRRRGQSDLRGTPGPVLEKGRLGVPDCLLFTESLSAVVSRVSTIDVCKVGHFPGPVWTNHSSQTCLLSRAGISRQKFDKRKSGSFASHLLYDGRSHLYLIFPFCSFGSVW